MDKLSTYSGFFDLSIHAKKNSIRKTLEVAKQLGYNVVAIDTHLEESIFEIKKKKKGAPREVVDIIPEPVALSEDAFGCAKDIKILHRLTVEYSNSLQAHKLMQSENFKKYDIVAVIPLSQNSFQYACSSMDVDLITFNPGCQPPYRIPRKMYSMATDRGIFFELMYSPAITDNTSRRNIISLSHMYHSIGKSKNIIVSSGGSSHYDLRSPYDVMNLCLIFGMNEEMAKCAMTNSCRRLYIRSVSRRCGKAVVWVSKVPSSGGDASSMDEDNVEAVSPSSGVLPEHSSHKVQTSSDSEGESQSPRSPHHEHRDVAKPTKRFKSDAEISSFD